MKKPNYIKKRKQEIKIKAIKVALLKKAMKKQWGFKWYQKDLNQIDFFKDLKYFNEEVLDVLLTGEPGSLPEAIILINDWIQLECIMTKFNKKRYSIGVGKTLFAMIDAQRILYYQINDLK